MLDAKEPKPPYILEYHPYSEYSLLIQWPQIVSENILEELSAFKKTLQSLYPVAILTAAYASILLVFPERIASFPALKAQIKKDYKLFSEEKIKGLLDLKDQGKKVKNTIKTIQAQKILYKIPVCYEAAFAPDLDFVCDNLKLSPEALVSRHSNTTYTVYGIGFLPGFMYLGGLDAGLEISRKLSPRMKVPSGSVGLAAKQTGIYPCESPGGWQLIGQTPIPLFNPLQDPPFFAEVGDKIQFIPISKDTYKLLQIQVAAGIYNIEKTIYTQS
jgi:inhibitor of KinA